MRLSYMKLTDFQNFIGEDISYNIGHTNPAPIQHTVSTVSISLFPTESKETNLWFHFRLENVC